MGRNLIAFASIAFITSCHNSLQCWGIPAYTFGKDHGIDVIKDGDYSPKLFGSPADRLKFLDGITWGDLEFIRDGASDTLELRLAGTDNAVILKDQEETGFLQGFINLVEQIQFGDGTVWTYQQLFQHFVNLSQTDGADTVYGFHTADLITGGLGNDNLQGQGGNDRYVWQPGDGSDRIFDTGGGNDTLEIRGANALDFVISRTPSDLILTHVVSDSFDRARDQPLRHWVFGVTLIRRQCPSVRAWRRGG